MTEILTDIDSVISRLDRTLAETPPDRACALLVLTMYPDRDINHRFVRSEALALLGTLADRLRRLVPQDAILGRSARDFQVIHPGVQRSEEAMILAARLHEAFDAPVPVGDALVTLRAAIGVAVADADCHSAEALLQRANIALRHATSTTMRQRLFEPQMLTSALARRALEQELRLAVAAEAFTLHYQPQIDLRTGRIVGFEALLRWQHPRLGAVPPDEFIPLAEEIDLIGKLGAWVIAEACREAASWPEAIMVAVNVSADQFSATDLPAIVFAALDAAGLSPSRLELEITESVMMRSDADTLLALDALRGAGVRIAIDDFGAGYSSFGYLTRLPFDKIKIDRSFATCIQPEQEVCQVGLSVIRSIIGLCDSLGVPCTAEGVENADYLDLLTRESCTQAQGYLFGRPAPPHSVPALLARLNPPIETGGALRALPVSVPISFYQIAEKANDIILVTTPDLDPPGPVITYVNPAFTRLTGYPAREVIGRSPRILQGPGTSRATLDRIREGLRHGRDIHEKILNYAKCGAPYWLDMRITALRDAHGAVTHFVAVERDVTMDKRRLDELEYVADRDTLTGIPNRRFLLRGVEAEIRSLRTETPPDGFCLAFVDIDHFKQVNDRFGHATGDAVLFGIADRLAENVRRSDIIGRIGGEEFAIGMPAVTLADARILAQRLHSALTGAPFPTPSGPVSVTVSIGVAACRKGDTLEALMDRADAAMYAAKHAGRDRVMVEQLV